MLTNINCKHNLNMYLACSSTNFLCPTSKITLQKWAIAQVLINKEGHKAGGVRKGAGRKKRFS